jgi:tetratricopeptide (TPR) repeat protein
MTADEVRQALGEVLVSPQFARSPKMARLLRYLVEQKLAGRAEGCKEMVIAAEVYGKAADYDPSVDSLVRVEMSRLRGKLRAHYEGAGAAAEIVFEIPAGSYEPQWRAGAPAGEVRRAGAWWVWVAGLAAMVGLVWFGVLSWRQGRVMELCQQAAGMAPEDRDLLLRTAREMKAAPLERLMRAAALYEEAAGIDPDSEEAWTGLARTYWQAGDYDPAMYGRAEQAAKRAVRLNERNSAAHFYLGHIAMFHRKDSGTAWNEMKRAQELNPRNESVYRYLTDLCLLRGRAEEVLPLLDAGQRYLPESEVVRLARLAALANLRRWDELRREAAALLRRQPDLAAAHRFFAESLLESGQAPEAEAAYGKCLNLLAASKPCLLGLGRARARQGKRGEVREVIERLRQLAMHAASVAVLYAEIGEKGAALEWLERAFDERDDGLPYVLAGEGVRGLAGEARYRALEAKARVAAR